MKKVRRLLDGKVYAVHGTRPIVIMGITVRDAVDVFVSAVAQERLEPGIDVNEVVGRYMWLDGYEVVAVPDSTPVDVS